MSDVAISVENLSKRYRIGLKEEMHDTMAGMLVELFKQPVKNLRRLRRLSSFEENGRDSEDIIWALKDVSFEVREGEIVGIIGPNGAGKTTLLKILSRITEPTKGRASIVGRVSSLLEVGTGFHGELTGRENVYLNVVVLGMTRSDIDRRFDQIVDFSGVERFLDTPVKRYSFGLRLAFAVAAHLEPEILLVDEVLAVGDAAFQKKCLGRMEEAAREGQTVLLVSHNMGSIGSLCERALLIDEGRIVLSGDTGHVIARYLQEQTVVDKAELTFPDDPTKPMCIRAVRVLDHEGNPSTTLDRAKPFRIEVTYQVRERIINAYVGVTLATADRVTRICTARDTESAPNRLIERQPGTYVSTVEFPGELLNIGSYMVSIGLHKSGVSTFDGCRSPAFDLIDTGGHGELSNFLASPQARRSGPAFRLDNGGPQI